MLQSIKEAFNVGSVYPDRKSNTYIYYVSSREELCIIFDYLDKFSLKIPSKRADYVTFKRLFSFKGKNYHLRDHPLHYRFLNLAKLLKNRQ